MCSQSFFKFLESGVTVAGPLEQKRYLLFVVCEAGQSLGTQRLLTLNGLGHGDVGDSFGSFTKDAGCFCSPFPRDSNSTSFLI